MSYLLKKLELGGFKSFADKTVFDFSGGITAIVGPNGCGKSNIIDAIRWLLGEREARNLRSAKAEDLIFAGTSKRPKMGLAWATLYFDNKQKFFPVDFSEVTIKREINRDGSAFYFLNKSEIRLKDLIDFLAKCRLGTQGMTIITQGNSDVFVRSLPEQRRLMIEEMLGLKEYRLKKREAERRLKNTKINLDKAKALIEEILPHLRSLRRQTSRWQKREILEKELEENLKLFFGHKINEINLNLKATKEQIKNHLLLKNDLLANKNRAEKKLKEIEDLQPEERKKLQEIKIKINDLMKQKNELQKEMARLEVSLEKSSYQTSQAVIDYRRIFDSINEIKMRLKKIIKEDDLKNIKDEIKGIITYIEEILNYKENKNEDLKIKQELELVNKKLTAIDRDIEILEEKEKDLEKNQDEFYHLFKKAVEEVRQADSELEKWEQVHQSLIFEKEKLEIKFNELKHQINQFGRKIEEFENIYIPQTNQVDLIELEKKIWRLQGELAAIGEIDQSLLLEAQKTEERYSFLEEQLKDLEKASADLNALIKELDEKIEQEFKKAFHQINLEFNKFFKIMFGGGYAKLKLSFPNKKNEKESNNDLGSKIKEIDSEENIKESGIEIELRLPMKKLTSLDVLSGGEKSLVGIAALFAIISVSPPPFLVLDEIDAMLDERNARRFAQMLREFSSHTQFIVVTHNRAVMEAADIIYGITLGEDETSKVVSLKLEK